MKIGILTYHCVPNFGAQLQALSTVGYLKKQGHTPYIIHWYPDDLKEMYSKRIPAQQILCHDKFTEDYLPITEICKKEEDVINVIDRYKFDGLLVGSDALFKYIPERERWIVRKRKLKIERRRVLTVENLKCNPFFGGFLSRIEHKIPAVVFSVSSQNCLYTRMKDSEKETMKNYLENYIDISVRDNWTKQMVECVTGRKDIKITPDPVFSFNYNVDDIAEIESLKAKYKIKGKYVLLSFSSWYNKKTYLDEVATELSKNGLQPVFLTMPEGLYASDNFDKIDVPINPLEWYTLIKCSNGYIGERMHPIVVSLHNSTPFYCFDEYGKLSKYWDLIRSYEEESSKTFCILKDADFLNNMYSYNSGKPLPQPSEIVNKILTFDRQKCNDFAELKKKEYDRCMEHAVSLIQSNIKTGNI